MQPRTEIRSRLETAQLSIGFQEGLLNHVFGVLRRTCQTVSEPVDSAAVALNERPESIAIPVAGQRDSSGVRLRHPVA
jgi:hypothetical protein